MERKYSLEEILDHIDPAYLNYAEWTEVGQALKLEGYPCEVWDRWSRRDSGRFHEGECEKKWRSFRREEGVTGGTIYHLAVQQGWSPIAGGDFDELDLDGSISYELPDSPIVGEGWAEHRDVEGPKGWDPVGELSRYLETLFTPDEIFGYVTQSFEKPDKNGHTKMVPANKGIYTKKVGEILKALRSAKKSGETLESIVGKYDPAAGAWIRFNPLDGNGVNNENVSDFRYALVESDSMEIEAQNGIIRQLNLPVAVLVHSGGKSLHAIVRIDADDIKEYQSRVNYMYDICKKNGMVIDTQNRNPSRLSRMPGCIRGDKKQYIVGTNIGCKSWDEWKEWTEAVNDDLPDFEELITEWNDLPELAPELIEGVLREGHKMLIAGPSKAGKSFDLIELAIAIAEGGCWHGFKCRQGRVLYVNLELDRASCLHRFRDVYDALGARPNGIGNVDIWNLRGRSLPMDKLAPKLIRRAKDRHYKAVIVDPIYKVITGDENSADQMAKFCNQFDKVCTELKAAAIYCHHHSKGAQGGKRSMDRASGSGVFARDPDAMIDMIELELPAAAIDQEINKAVCAACRQFLEAHVTDRNWSEELSQDDLLMAQKVVEYCRNAIGDSRWNSDIFEKQISEAAAKARSMTAWRLEGTLREFAKFDPVNCWFRYPVHVPDESGVLSDIEPETEKPVWEKAKEARKKQATKNREAKRNALEIAFTSLELEGAEVSMQALAETMGKSVKALGAALGDGQKANKDWKKSFEKYTNEDGKTYVRRKNNEGVRSAPDHGAEQCS